MSEQVYVVEVQTDLNESDELFSDSNFTNIVTNYSSNVKTTSESMNHIFFEY